MSTSKKKNENHSLKYFAEMKQQIRGTRNISLGSEGGREYCIGSGKHILPDSAPMSVFCRVELTLIFFSLKAGFGLI